MAGDAGRKVAVSDKERSETMGNESDTNYTQVEVFEGDTIETVAQRLAAAAPAACIYDGVEVRVEAGQDPADVVKRYLRFRQTANIQKRLDLFGISNVEVIPIESPGPGKPIDPWSSIRNPVPGGLWVLWERRADHTIGTVAVVVGVPAENIVDGRKGLALQVQHAPVVTALGSLLVELSFRAAASEARIEALEARIERIDGKEARVWS